MTTLTHKATEGPGPIKSICEPGHYMLAERWVNVDCPECLKFRPSMRLRVYFDLNDWWVGYYRGPNHHYVLLLPTLVIRWGRKS